MGKSRGKEPTPITAEEFDKKFDEGEDVSEHLDWDAAVKRVNVDFPVWMLEVLDGEAKRLGAARQFIIKQWIDEKIRERGLLKKESA